MPNRVAVILAHNPGNCGMYSVDVAALKAFEGKADIAFFSEGARPAGSYFERFDLGAFRGVNALADYEKVVFWGDFTTSPHYGLADYRRIYDRRPPRAPSFIRGTRFHERIAGPKALREWAQRYLPQSAHNAVYSIGQNFQITSPRIDAVYREYAERYANFSRIATRDRVSCENLLTRVASVISWGSDAAFFAGPVPRQGGGARRRKLAVFFHRSGFANIEAVVGDLVKRFDLEPIFFPDWLRPKMPVQDAYNASIARLAQCDFAMSDTYHFLINATRAGMPVIGFGVRSPVQTDTLTDFKKRILFEELGIADQYVETESRVLEGENLGKVAMLVEKMLSGGGNVGRPDMAPTQALIDEITG